MVPANFPYRQGHVYVLAGILTCAKPCGLRRCIRQYFCTYIILEFTRGIIIILALTLLLIYSCEIYEDSCYHRFSLYFVADIIEV